MSIVFVGIDLAKKMFPLHGVYESGGAAFLRPTMRREQLLEVIPGPPQCTIGMKAYSDAHHWARQFQQFGHTVLLRAPKHVSPYRMNGKCGKNDTADAAAICEAMQRPKMRFVPIKRERARPGFEHAVAPGMLPPSPSPAQPRFCTPSCTPRLLAACRASPILTIT